MGNDKPDVEYSHPEHGEIEWYTFDGWDRSIEGWRCTRCHVIAEEGRADETFDNHDCDQYKSVREGVTGSI